MLRAKAEDSKSSGAGVVDDKKKDGKDAKSGKKKRSRKVATATTRIITTVKTKT